MKKIYTLLVIFMLSALLTNVLASPCADCFVTVWNVEYGTIRYPGTGTNYAIYWEEVGNPSNNSSLIGNNYTTITFPSNGVYKISVDNHLKRFEGDATSQGEFLQEVKQWGNIQWTTMNSAFKNCINLQITATDVPDLSQVTDISYMFYGANSFNQPLNNWDVSNVTDMLGVFLGASSFNQPLNNWDVSNVTEMFTMFLGASNFNQSLNDWNIKSINPYREALYDIFSNSGMDCKNYSATLIGWAGNSETPNNLQLRAEGIYYGDDAIDARNILIAKGWTIRDAGLGVNCSNVFITIWDLSNGNPQLKFPGFGTNYNIYWEEVGNPSNQGALLGNNNTIINFPSNGVYKISVNGNFNYIKGNATSQGAKLLEVQQWGNIHWTTMNNAFSYCSNLQITATDVPDLSNVTDMTQMFAEASSFNQPVNNWNVSNITKMTSMFYSASNFNQPLDNWDVSNVTLMYAMFNDASSFNQPLNNWDVSNVTNMSWMFSGASSFNQPLDNWDVSSVRDMYIMFGYASSFNQPLNNWNVSNVTDMSSMFTEASSFNQPLNNWNVSNVTNMSQMFAGASSFNQPLNNWDVSNVTNMSAMFALASSFNQPLNNWNVSNVIDMTGIFYEASSFNRPLIYWDLSSITDIFYIFFNSGIDCQHYSVTLKGWASNPHIPSNLNIGTVPTTYNSSAVNARNTLISKGWIIEDHGLDTSCNPIENTLHIFVDTVYGMRGQQVEIPVKAVGFQKMLSAQNSFSFNPNVVEYAGILPNALTNITTDNIGTAQATNGKLTFVWSSPTLSGISVNDSATLFTLVFNVTGNAGDISDIALTDTPLAIEYVDSLLSEFTLNTTSGRVIVLASLNGQITTPNNEPVKAVTINAESTIIKTTETDINGNYALNVINGEDYTITPSKNNDEIPSNGITSLDYLIVQRHIWGNTPITSPYKLIAADVNSSGTITALDLSYIQSIITNNIQTFPGGKLWNFVLKEHTFANPQDPFPFPSSKTFTNVTTEATQDFYGIKLGDVNNTWDFSNARTSGADTVAFYVNNDTIIDDVQEFIVPIRASNFEEISAFQFSLKWDIAVLSFLGIDSSNHQIAIYPGNHNLSEGILPLMWVDPNADATSLANDEILFNLRFKPIVNGNITTQVTIVSDVTPIEVIDYPLNILPVNTIGGNIYIAQRTTKIKQPSLINKMNIYPNPTSNWINIDLNLKKEADVQLSVLSTDGKQVLHKNYSKIINLKDAVDVSQLAKGIYLIQLNANGDVQTQKLIKE